MGVLAGMALLASTPARAEGAQREKSGEFQQSKVNFGQDHLRLTLAADEEKPGQKEKGEKEDQGTKGHHQREKAAKPKVETPAWLKGKTVGGWGGPTLNYLNLDMGIFDPLTDKRGLDGFKDVMYPVGGFGGGRIGALRIGGMGFGWDQRKSRGDKKAEVSLGMGGMVLEVEGDVLPKLGIIGGAMLGGGNIKLSAKGPDLAGGDWDQDEDFFVAYPYLGVSLKVLPFMRLEANYGWMFFDYSPGGADYRPGPGVKAVDGSLDGGGSGQVRLVFGYEVKTK
jgi:hypothetical protein